ncbi:type IV toxin-antitoxin system AbiEi family antitoxin domain-containing protein [Brevibacterium aurantiacum]|uniref:AbiEi antitoxin N-terminal domain-containing protein n=1 Tax=Brevibacterium aurantiacum TaxID=273384 RepID=A0A1D7VYQ4_BREAU|nr:type IV toxin-antitoxin system AbiEi family antitoxin domain-containing protein [Brevibacterium aurantiacum]MDN5910867.1 type IV toxin-antitoxin system AbiEi family antitoxin domain-containing protein [Brevibacterium sp.]AOP51857.1 hypothetical protein BLSMQ_0135 [Brevibacterium aurantiacum]AZL07909.1 hypothetical protein CXR26_00660 [Brevibacterium aurantiacum]MDN6668188.1 type IV toxin-antitoxin system AbiEi family antitoxin domain-containing protein [Brevibacterium sp.]PCC48241.1 hypothe
MSYRHDLWEIAAEQHGVVNIADAENAGVPAVEVRKLAHRGALRAYGNGVYLYRDIPTTDLTQYEGIPATTAHRALEDLRTEMPPERWRSLVEEANRRELIGAREARLLDMAQRAR